MKRVFYTIFCNLPFLNKMVTLVNLGIFVAVGNVLILTQNTNMEDNQDNLACTVASKKNWSSKSCFDAMENGLL
jgi:hypothetical protein